jgi:transcription elongation factor Elf1
MGTDTLNVTFKCKKCGGTVLSLPNNATDDSIAHCKSCGERFGRWGDIKGAAKRNALIHMRDRLTDAFKGLKGWNVKRD